MPNKYIPLSEPFFFKKDYNLLKKCIDDGWVSTSGKFVDLFENKISKYTGSKYSIATVNGTSALHISLKVAGVLENDEVIVSSLTFIAPINAIKYNLANPIFMDVDNFGNIDEKKTIEFILNETEYIKGITFNKNTKKRISAIIIVHVWGNAASFSELKLLCEKRNIKIIEDASESLGTFYTYGAFKDKHTGTIGSFGCLSFNGNKIITSGGGGMILTNKKLIAEKIRYYINQSKDDSFNFIHNEVGFNFKLPNLNSALGLTQLEKIDLFIKKKRLIHKRYLNAVSKISGLRILSCPEYAKNNHWLNILNIDERIYHKSKKKLIKEFLDNNIQVRPIWHLNHLQKPYKTCQSFKINFAKKFVKNCICLPSSFSLTKKEQSEIIKIMESKNGLG